MAYDGCWLQMTDETLGPTGELVSATAEEAAVCPPCSNLQNAFFVKHLGVMDMVCLWSVRSTAAGSGSLFGYTNRFQNNV